MPRGWGTDWQLRLRMLLAFVLLFAFNTLIVTLVLLPFYLSSGRLPPVLPVLGVTVLFFLAQIDYTYFKTLRDLDDREVSPDEYPDLHARVERLSLTVDIEKPDIAVLNSDVPNAFATTKFGWDSRITVTDALLEELGDDELDAVLAHEIAHIKNRDAVLMTIALVPATLCEKALERSMNFMNRMEKNQNIHEQGTIEKTVTAIDLLISRGAFFFLSIFAASVSFVFRIVGIWIFEIISDYREYAADLGAAKLTSPADLVTALKKMKGMRDRPQKDLREYAGGMNSLYIVPTLEKDAALVTHPPIAKRIERLEKLAS